MEPNEQPNLSGMKFKRRGTEKMSQRGIGRSSMISDSREEEADLISKSSGTCTDYSVSVMMPAPELDEEGKNMVVSVAHDIFMRYIAKDADKLIYLEPNLRQAVHLKFGYFEPLQTQSFGIVGSFQDALFDEQTLRRNINFELFRDVLKPVTMELKKSYEAF